MSNFEKLLFPKRKNKVFEVNYGTAYVPGLRATIKHTNLAEPMRYNACLAMFDDILSKKNVSVYVNKSKLQCVYERDGEWGVYNAESMDFTFSSDKAEKNIGILPMFAMICKKIPQFDTIKTDLKLGKLPTPKLGLDLSDIFECEYVLPAVEGADFNISMSTDSFVAQLRASIRSGFYKRDFPEVESFNKGKSIFDTEETSNNATVSSHKKVEKNDLMDEIKAGKYLIPYEWSDEQKRRIRPLSSLDSFVITESWVEELKIIHKRAMRALEAMDMGIPFEKANCLMNGLLTGKPGTGKSMSIYALAAATGLPIDTIAIRRDTDRGLVEGENRIVDSVAQFKNSLISEHWGEPGITLIEEPNLIRGGDIMGLLGQVLDKPYKIYRNGCEEVMRNHLRIVFMCQNAGIEGTNPASPAMLRRSNMKWVVPDPDPESFKKIIMNQAKVSEQVASYLQTSYDKIVRNIKDPDSDCDRSIADALSVQQCIDVIDVARDAEIPLKKAMQHIFGATASNFDYEIGERVNDWIDGLPEPPFTL